MSERGRKIDPVWEGGVSKRRVEVVADESGDDYARFNLELYREEKSDF